MKDLHRRRIKLRLNRNLAKLSYLLLKTQGGEF